MPIEINGSQDMQDKGRNDYDWFSGKAWHKMLGHRRHQWVQLGLLHAIPNAS